jgi:hypothetical protein
MLLLFPTRKTSEPRSNEVFTVQIQTFREKYSPYRHSKSITPLNNRGCVNRLFFDLIVTVLVSTALLIEEGIRKMTRMNSDN